MQAPPEKQRSAEPGKGGRASNDHESGSGKQRYKVTPPHAQSLQTVAAIAKSHCSQLRVSLSVWRGRHSIELRD